MNNPTWNPGLEFTNIAMSHIICLTSSFSVLRRVWQSTLLKIYKYPQVLCSHLNREKSAKHSSSTFSCMEVTHEHTAFTELEIILSQHEIISLKSPAFINLSIQDTYTSKKGTVWAAQDIRKLLSWTAAWYILLTGYQISLTVVTTIIVWTAFKITVLDCSVTSPETTATGQDCSLHSAFWNYFQMSCSITHITNICQLKGTIGSSLWNNPVLVIYQHCFRSM